MPEKQALTIAQEPLLDAAMTDSTSEDEARGAFLRRAREICELPNPDLFWAVEYLCDGNMKALRGEARVKVYLFIVRMTAGYHQWRSEPLSIRDIAGRAGCGRRSVFRALMTLETLGLVLVDKPTGYGSGSREGVICTLMLPEAVRRKRRRPERPQVAGQTTLPVNPPWVVEELEAATIAAKADLTGAATFILRLQAHHALLDSEMALWIRHVAGIIATSRQPIERPMGFFRRVLEAQLAERGTRRVPVGQGEDAQAVPDEEFDRWMAGSA